MKHLFLCAGRPHPFSDKPVFMLTCPDGDYTLEKIVRAASLTSRDCIFAVRREDEERYEATASFKELFGSDITVHIVDEGTSAGPMETVVQTVEALALSGPLVIRDSDSYFQTPFPEKPGDFVAFGNLDESPAMPARSLSFLKVSDQSVVLDIQERHAISNLFAAGAYSFQDAAVLPGIYRRLSEQSQGQIYVSECVKECIFSLNAIFRALPVQGFVDWGSSKGWRDWCEPKKTYFVDLDGVLCSNGGRKFKPRQENAQPIEENVAVLRRLAQRGAQIVITTSRMESMRTLTTEQLAKWDVPFARLVMGCLHQQRVIVNDHSRTNPYPSCVAVNMARNARELESLIGQKDD